MSKTLRNILFLLVIVTLIGILSFGWGKKYALNRLVEPQKERVDTLFIFDTIVEEKPIFKEKKVVEKVLVHSVDTIMMRDTLYMVMEREQIHWKDSLSDVYASGIMVEVDSVKHYLPTRVITIETEKVVKVKPRWSLGVHAGYGVHVGSQIQAAPYVGVGVSYNIFSW